MARWRVVHRGGAEETVEADELRHDPGAVLLVDWRVVVMRPREVVVRRLAVADVERVEPAGDG